MRPAPLPCRCFDKDAVDQKAAERAGLSLDEAWSVDEVRGQRCAAGSGTAATAQRRLLTPPPASGWEPGWGGRGRGGQPGTHLAPPSALRSRTRRRAVRAPAPAPARPHTPCCDRNEKEGGPPPPPQVNLYERLGLDTLKKFSTAFYTSFYDDEPYYE